MATALDELVAQTSAVPPRQTPPLPIERQMFGFTAGACSVEDHAVLAHLTRLGHPSRVLAVEAIRAVAEHGEVILPRFAILNPFAQVPPALHVRTTRSIHTMTEETTVRILGLRMWTPTDGVRPTAAGLQRIPGRWQRQGKTWLIPDSAALGAGAITAVVGGLVGAVLGHDFGSAAVGVFLGFMSIMGPAISLAQRGVIGSQAGVEWTATTRLPGLLPESIRATLVALREQMPQLQLGLLCEAHWHVGEGQPVSRNELDPLLVARLPSGALAVLAQFDCTTAERYLVAEHAVTPR